MNRHDGWCFKADIAAMQRLISFVRLPEEGVRAEVLLGRKKTPLMAVCLILQAPRQAM